MDKLGEALLIIKGEAPTHPSYRDVFLMNVGLVEKEIQRLRAELEALKAAHTWQPIETAPKDGSHVLLWRNDIQFVGYLAAAGWCSTSVRLIEPPPTHWMPLPPTDSEEENNE